ncbi:hypothetical protein V6N12_066930 [Hibiscus sabdariffa]
MPEIRKNALELQFETLNGQSNEASGGSESLRTQSLYQMRNRQCWNLELVALPGAEGKAAAAVTSKNKHERKEKTKAAQAVVEFGFENIIFGCHGAVGSVQASVQSDGRKWRWEDISIGAQGSASMPGT